jgi:hypothetical protein
MKKYAILFLIFCFSVAKAEYTNRHTLAINQKFYIPEAVSNGDSVGQWRKNWTYRYGESVTYTYTLLDNYNGAFAISATGGIYIADATKINGQITTQDVLINLRVRTTADGTYNETDTAIIGVKEAAYCHFYTSGSTIPETFTPGHGYFFQRGQTFVSISRHIEAHLGSSAHPTVFAAYGSGNIPVFNGNSYGGFIWVGDVNDNNPINDRVEFVQFYNLKVRNYASYAFKVIRTSCNMGFYNLIIQNNDKNDNESSIIITTGSYADTMANRPFEFINCQFDTTSYGASAPAEPSYIKIGVGPAKVLNCRFGAMPGAPSGAMSVRLSAGHGSEIKHCLFTLGTNFYWGIQVRQDGALIEDCHLNTNNSWMGIALTNATGAYEMSSDNVTIRNVKITGGVSAFGIAHDPASELYYTFDNLIIEDCDISGCGSYGIRLYHSVGNKIRRNRIYNSDQFLEIRKFISGPARNDSVYYNLFYGRTGDEWGVEIHSTNTKIFNNISDCYINLFGVSKELRNNFVRYISQESQNTTSNNIDLDNITISDYFTNYAQGDFTLKSTATMAIDNGFPVNIPVDYFKKAITEAPDIGACEYGTIPETEPQECTTPLPIIEYKTGANNGQISYNMDVKGETFTIADTSILKEVDFVMYRETSGSQPGTCVVNIRNVSGGLPTTVLYTANINANAFTTSADTARALFNNIIYPGTYSTDFRFTNADVNNAARYRLNVSGGFAGGSMVSSNDGGNTWSQSTQDLIFVIKACPYVEVVPEVETNVYYIHPDSNYNDLADINSLYKNNDTILIYAGYEVTTSGFYVNNKYGVVIGKYGEGQNPRITGFFDVSGGFTKSGNIYTKQISSFTSNYYNSNAWFNEEHTPVSGLNYLLINSKKHLLGKYPNDYYLVVDDTLSPNRSGFIDNNLNGLFPPGFWNNSTLLIHSVDWINTRQPCATSSSNGTFNISYDWHRWAGLELLSWHNYQGRTIKYFITNHPNCNDVDGEWSFTISNKNLSVYSLLNLNDQVVKLSLHDSVVAINNSTNIEFKNIDFEGGNKFTVGNKNSKVKYENCTFRNCAMAIVSINSDISVNNCSFIDITQGAITTLGQFNTNVYGCLFKNIAMDKEHVNGDLGVLNDNRAIRFTPSLPAVLNVQRCRFDSLGGSAVQGSSSITTECMDTLLYKNSLVTNVGGMVADMGGGYYSWMIEPKYGLIEGCGIFNKMIDEEWAMKPPSWDGQHGIYFDGYTDKIIAQYNTIAHFHNSFLNNAGFLKVFRNNICAFASKAEVRTIDESWNQATRNIFATNNIFLTKDNSTQGWQHVRYNTAYTPGVNVIDSNLYLNWNNSDANVWGLSTNYGLPSEMSLSSLRTNYGFEQHGSVNNASYDTAIVFYNWKSVADTIHFTGTGYNHSGSELTNDYIIIQPYRGSAIRFSSFTSITNPEKYTIYPGLVISEASVNPFISGDVILIKRQTGIEYPIRINRYTGQEYIHVKRQVGN